MNVRQDGYSSAAQRLKKIDWHTTLFIKLIRKAVKDWNGDKPTFDQIGKPQHSGELPMMMLPFTEGRDPIRLPTQDEDWDKSDTVRRIALAFLRNKVTFPLKDVDDRWSSLDEAKSTFQEILPMGGMMRRPYHHWDSVTSDDAMARLAFAGLGALRLMLHESDDGQPEVVRNAWWSSDFGYMASYPVRPGFEKYGAIAYFSKEQRLVAIRWSHGNRVVEPGDPEWEHAKWAWRCTMMVGTTVTDHLVGVHWLIGNFVVSAARTCLGADHYLRKLLKPFTWRTVTINANASDSLLPERGFVHRASALTYDGLMAAFADSVAMMKFNTVPELIAFKGAEGMGNQFPWATDALALWHVVRGFVDEFIAAYTTEEDLLVDTQLHAFWDYLETAPDTVKFPTRTRESIVDVLAQFIWSVTGLHEAVGTVHEYVLDPSFMGTKIRPGATMSDVQSSLQFFLILALTGLAMPGLLTMGDAESIFGEDMRGRTAFQNFHDRLQALSETIAAANRARAADPERPWPCQTFDPANLETAVSI